MKKIVLHKCYGGFEVSDLVIEEYLKLTGFEIGSYCSYLREDEILISIVERLGKKASGSCSALVVVKIPDNVFKDYVIDEYDGIEILHKKVEEY